MNTVDLVQQKVAVLPKEIQLQVLDFVNFLAAKYVNEEDEALLKEFLLHRAKMVKKPKRTSLDDLRKKVLNKYSDLGFDNIFSGKKELASLAFIFSCF